MNATLPLPLELTRPIELPSYLEASLKETFEVAYTKYNDQTQVRENSEGIPEFCHHRGSKCSQQCHSTAGAAIIDVTIDIQIDDNDF
jgi:hypothetical protein